MSNPYLSTNPVTTRPATVALGIPLLVFTVLCGIGFVVFSQVELASGPAQEPMPPSAFAVAADGRLVSVVAPDTLGERTRSAESRQLSVEDRLKRELLEALHTWAFGRLDKVVWFDAMTVEDVVGEFVGFREQIELRR